MEIGSVSDRGSGEGGTRDEQATTKARRVVEEDVARIIHAAGDAFERIAGHHMLVTGGAGFLGFELVHAALHWNRQAPPERSIRVTLLDNFARGVPSWLGELQGEPGLGIVRHDITQPLPRELGPLDYVVHAAGIASPTYYRLHPIETMDANVTGLRLLLDRCVEQQAAGHPLRGVLYFSSSEIYGDPPASQIPTPETYRGNVSCTGPRSCYDESKRYGETLCVNFARQHGLPIVSVRPFNNYGPGLKISDRRVIPDFARDVLAGRDIVMLSDGAPTRTFCYVSDAVSGYYKALALGRAGEAYNIGVEDPEISVADLARLVTRIASELFGYSGRVVLGVSEEPDYLVDNPNRRRPDLAKARSEIGYAPSVGLEEGLRRSLLWYDANRDDTAG
jgi:UDP-glucuronate decarboxylase